jgi:acyl dehydratase
VRAIHRLQFETRPSAWSIYPQLVRWGKPAILAAGEDVPHIEALLPKVHVSLAHFEAYNRICGVRDSSYLPIAYPHMLAAPLHLSILATRAFPVRALGLVHVANQIVQHRVVRPDEPGDLRVWVAGHRVTERGQEFDFHSELRVSDAIVWEETSAYLARRRSRSVAARDAALRGQRANSDSLDPDGPSKSVSFRVPANIGRRYARISGDFNPIHLSKFTAKPFGFGRAIAHGMWTLARCAAELERELLSAPCELSVTFKLPILLPAWVLLQHWRRDDGFGLSLRDAHAARAHLVGRLRRLG